MYMILIQGPRSRGLGSALNLIVLSSTLYAFPRLMHFRTDRVLSRQRISLPEKTADISRRHHWFPREMTSGKRAQKFNTDDFD